MRINLDKKSYIDISPDALKVPKDKFIKEMIKYHSDKFSTGEEAEKAFTECWTVVNPTKGGKPKDEKVDNVDVEG